MDELKEIPLPLPVSWFPQTAGWYVVAALVAVGLVWLLLRFVRHWRANRYRRDALAELERIRRTSSAGELPELVKRVALRIAPRAGVAALTGSQWLAFLDQSYGGTGFSKGPGQALPVIAYQGTEKIATEQVDTLFQLVGEWIRKHHVVV